MNLKFFYVIAGGWIIVLMLRNATSDVEDGIYGTALVLLFVLVFAVQGLSQRIDRITKAIHDPNFDAAAADRREWIETVTFFLSLMALLVLVTALQGAYRCLSSAGPLSVGCVWQGFLEQAAEDLR